MPEQKELWNMVATVHWNPETEHALQMKRVTTQYCEKLCLISKFPELEISVGVITDLSLQTSKMRKYDITNDSRIKTVAIDTSA